jgi:sugar lactone lactonase YvrE
MSLTPVDILRVGNELGEGISWRARDQTLWWTDIQSSRLYRYTLATGSLQFFETPERVGSFGFVADTERLITAFASGIALYDPQSKRLDWRARPERSGGNPEKRQGRDAGQPEEVTAGVRFNDGRVDRQGRFWAGTMVENGKPPARGCLYSLESTGEARSHIQGVMISNGLCFSPDGTRLYFTDSPTRLICAYELLEPEGILVGREPFAQIPEGASPDGATVDVDGCVWSAHWGSGSVVRYTPNGRVDRVIALPTRQPSCVCFAGPDLDILCVTTAREDLDDSVLHA